jgi:hypothetical protein
LQWWATDKASVLINDDEIITNVDMLDDARNFRDERRDISNFVDALDQEGFYGKRMLRSLIKRDLRLNTMRLVDYYFQTAGTGAKFKEIVMDDLEPLFRDTLTPQDINRIFHLRTLFFHWGAWAEFMQDPANKSFTEGDMASQVYMAEISEERELHWEENGEVKYEGDRVGDRYCQIGEFFNDWDKFLALGEEIERTTKKSVKWTQIWDKLNINDPFMREAAFRFAQLHGLSPIMPRDAKDHASYKYYKGFIYGHWINNQARGLNAVLSRLTAKYEGAIPGFNSARGEEMIVPRGLTFRVRDVNRDKDDVVYVNGKEHAYKLRGWHLGPILEMWGLEADPRKPSFYSLDLDTKQTLIEANECITFKVFQERLAAATKVESIIRDAVTLPENDWFVTIPQIIEKSNYTQTPWARMELYGWAWTIARYNEASRPRVESERHDFPHKHNLRQRIVGATEWAMELMDIGITQGDVQPQKLSAVEISQILFKRMGGAKINSDGWMDLFYLYNLDEILATGEFGENPLIVAYLKMCDDFRNVPVKELEDDFKRYIKVIRDDRLPTGYYVLPKDADSAALIPGSYHDINFPKKYEKWLARKSEAMEVHEGQLHLGTQFIPLQEHQDLELAERFAIVELLSLNPAFCYHGASLDHFINEANKKTLKSWDLYAAYRASRRKAFLTRIPGYFLKLFGQNDLAREYDRRADYVYTHNDAIDKAGLNYIAGVPPGIDIVLMQNAWHAVWGMLTDGVSFNPQGDNAKVVQQWRLYAHRMLLTQRMLGEKDGKDFEAMVASLPDYDDRIEELVKMISPGNNADAEIKVESLRSKEAEHRIPINKLRNYPRFVRNTRQAVLVGNGNVASGDEANAPHYGTFWMEFKVLEAYTPYSLAYQRAFALHELWAVGDPRREAALRQMSAEERELLADELIQENSRVKEIANPDEVWFVLMGLRRKMNPQRWQALVRLLGCDTEIDPIEGTWGRQVGAFKKTLVDAGIPDTNEPNKMLAAQELEKEENKEIKDALTSTVNSLSSVGNKLFVFGVGKINTAARVISVSAHRAAETAVMIGTPLVLAVTQGWTEPRAAVAAIVIASFVNASRTFDMTKVRDGFRGLWGQFASVQEWLAKLNIGDSNGGFLKTFGPGAKDGLGPQQELSAKFRRDLISGAADKK